MSQYPYQGQDPNQPQQQYGGYTPNQASGQPQPQQPYGDNPYGQPPQQSYGQPPQQPPYGQTAYGQNPPPYGQTQPPYGQPQSPYGQNPYGQQQAPYGQVPIGKQSFNLAYLIAGISGIVAFIAFFLPYFVVSSSIYSVAVNGSQLGGLYWLEFLLALAAIAAAAILQFGNQWFRNTSATSFLTKLNASTSTKPRNWSIALLAIGAAAFVLHILFQLTSASGAYGYAGLVSVGWGFGAILYLIAALGIAVGGFLTLRPDLLARFTKR